MGVFGLRKVAAGVVHTFKVVQGADVEELRRSLPPPPPGTHGCFRFSPCPGQENVDGPF